MAIRVGAENKKKVVIASVLGVLAILLVVRALFSTFAGGDSAPASVPAMRSGALPTTSGGRQARLLPGASLLDPTLHPEKMALAENTEYHGSGRNIFSKNSAPIDIPKPVASVRTTERAQPTGPPPPPPIDLRFYGFASKQGGKPRIFLLQGDEVYIASEGDVVARRYRVGNITPGAVVIQDMLNNNVQTIPLSQN